MYNSNNKVIKSYYKNNPQTIKCRDRIKSGGDVDGRTYGSVHSIETPAFQKSSPAGEKSLMKGPRGPLGEK